MYQVALCEDEKLFSQEQEKICRNILDKLNAEYQIDVFDSGQDFMKAFLQKQKRFDLILLDIIMEKPDGMDLARLVRQTDLDAAIIFITSNRDYALQGYDVQALHYLIKPVDSEILEKLIVSDYQGRFQNNFYIFETGAQKLRVAVKDIVSLETVGRQVAVTLLSGTAHYSGKLAELLSQLPQDRFIRCHQAFAINIQNIKELNRQDAIAANGKIIPISRTFAKDVKKAFLKQMRDG